MTTALDSVLGSPAVAIGGWISLIGLIVVALLKYKPEQAKIDMQRTDEQYERQEKWLAHIEVEVEKLRGQNETLTTNLRSATDDLARASRQIEQLKSDREATLASLHAELVQMRSQRDELHVEVERLRSEVNRLRDELTRLDHTA